jgi:dihydrodipicolinate synthase/N-acetylneuraminate lyase
MHGLLLALTVGVTSCITAIAAWTPKMMLDLYDSLMKKNLERARKT